MEYASIMDGNKCPTCRVSLPGGTTQLVSIQSAQDRVVHEADAGANAPRQKKRSREAGADYLLSGREKRRRVHNERNMEVSDQNSPLCVQSIRLLDDETDVRYRPMSNDGQNRSDDWDRTIDIGLQRRLAK